MPTPYSFGRNSMAQYVTLHHDLQLVLNEAIEVFDFSIDEGARSIETQIRYIRRGVTRTLDSYHIPRDEHGRYAPNEPALAADLIPYTKGVDPWPRDSDSSLVREKKKARFYYMQGILRRASETLGIQVRGGQDWDMDGDFFDQSFDDLGHVELHRPDRPKLIVEGELLEMANEALKSKGLPEWRKAA